MRKSDDRIESVQRVLRNNKIEIKVELKENYYFSGSGTQVQYFDSEDEMQAHLNNITYCDGL